MKIITFKMSVCALFCVLLPFSSIGQEKVIRPLPPESKPTVQKIDDITGYVTLLGKEEFRGSAGTKVLTLQEAIETAMQQNAQMLSSKLSLDQSLANVRLTESDYKNKFSLDSQVKEELQRMVGGRIRFDTNKGVIQENYAHWENRELFSVGPVYQRRFSDASTLTIQPNMEFENYSDGAFDSSASKPSGSNSQDRYNVNVTYNYYLNSKPREQIRQQMENAKLSAVQSDYEIYQTEKQTENSVITQYWRIKQGEEEVDIQNERLLQAKRIEFIIKTQYEFENASQMDVGQAEVDVMDSEATLIELEGSLRSTMERFNLVLGIPLEIDIKLADQLETTELPLKSSEYITLVTNTNLSLKDAQLNIQKLENSLRVAKLGQQPDVYLSGSVYDDNKGMNDLSGALIFSWPFGDGGATKARVDSLQKQLEQQKILLWNQERSLTTGSL